MTKPVGRPSDYTEEKAEAICELLAQGWSLKRVIEQGHTETKVEMPSIATVFKWMRDYNEFLKLYEKAKQEAADAMAEELLDIADNGTNDFYTDDNGVERLNSEHIQRSRLRIDTRKFLMAKMKPKRYGEKLDLTSDGERLQQVPLIISEIKSRNADTETEATTSG